MGCSWRCRIWSSTFLELNLQLQLGEIAAAYPELTSTTLT